MVDHTLNRSDFCLGHRFKVGKVKADDMLVNQLTCLMDVIAQYRTERCLQQVSSGMIAHD